ncbi:MAG: hypothetical protein KDJ17_09675 [Hyphomicrobiaceae bacterium]|nr:hypothetical protein [Hyphomicrobiaceae bacterium]
MRQRGGDNFACAAQRNVAGEYRWKEHVAESGHFLKVSPRADTFSAGNPPARAPAKPGAEKPYSIYSA